MGTETKQCKQQQNQSCNANSAACTKEVIDEINETAFSRTDSSDVPFVPVTVDENDVVSGAKDILKVIRPDWNLDSVKFKLFTDGITNKLVGCFNNGSPTDNDSASSPYHSVVLVRVYGNKTDLLIDRKAETRNIKLLHTYGFAPSLFATFKNGLAYEYVPGVTLTPETVIIRKIWSLIACRMAEMHKVSYGNGAEIDRQPVLAKKMQQFLDLVPERFSDASKHERLEKTFLPISRIRAEFDFLYERLSQLDSPIVFSHNDLLLGNIIYNESQNRVTFIDYEYADYNFQAFDIGNHFAEFAGVDEVDYARYPSKDFQLEWLRVYLQTFKSVNHVDPDEVEKLYVQVNQFTLAAHFFWTVWALIQAQHSDLDFDFVQYAHIRYNEYLARKEEFLSLGL